METSDDEYEEYYVLNGGAGSGHRRGMATEDDPDVAKSDEAVGPGFGAAWDSDGPRTHSLLWSGYSTRDCMPMWQRWEVPLTDAEQAAYKYFSDIRLPLPPTVEDVSCVDFTSPTSFHFGKLFSNVKLSGLARLRPFTPGDVNVWVEDEVMNAYVQFAAHGTDVRILESFFMHKVIDGHKDELPGWLNRKKVSLFGEHDTVIVFNKNKNHWMVLRFSPTTKTMFYYDSIHSDKVIDGERKRIDSFKTQVVLRSGEGVVLETLIDNLLTDLHKSKEAWHHVDVHVPQQHDAVNCGVFSSLFVSYICAQRSLDETTFSKTDVQQFRKHMFRTMLSYGNFTKELKDYLFNKEDFGRTRKKVPQHKATNTTLFFDLTEDD
jgi:hypothetical protein